MNKKFNPDWILYDDEQPNPNISNVVYITTYFMDMYHLAFFVYDPKTQMWLLPYDIVNEVPKEKGRSLNDLKDRLEGIPIYWFYPFQFHFYQYSYNTKLNEVHHNSRLLCLVIDEEENIHYSMGNGASYDDVNATAQPYDHNPNNKYLRIYEKDIEFPPIE
jgi:hypothetical protein